MEVDTQNEVFCSPELEAFLDHMRLERGLASNTCDSYRLDVTDFLRFLQQNDRSVFSATLDDGQQYTVRLSQRGLRSSSLARRVSALRSFYNYLTLAAIVPDNPLTLLTAPKIHRSLPHVLSVEDTARLIEAPDPTTPSGLRDRALWELMYASGLRVSEAAGAEFGDLDLDEGGMFIRGKGDRERWAPVGQSARTWVDRYVREARPLLADPGRPVKKIFLNERGRSLTRQGIWYLLKRYAAQLVPPLDVHPHTLRHCCATHLMEGGADLRTVQEFLGHADISTTQIYTQIDRNYLKDVHRTYHPRG